MLQATSVGLERYPLEFQEWILESEKNQRSLPTWDALEDPERLIEVFLKYPSKIKWRIISALKKGVEPESVEAFYTLCQTVRERFPDRFHVDHVDVAYVNNKTVISNPNNKFAVSMIRLKLRLSKEREIKDRQTYLESRYKSGIFKLLREIHNPERVREIIECAVHMEEFPEITTVRHLLDNWDELKDYPVDWSLHMIVTK